MRHYTKKYRELNHETILNSDLSTLPQKVKYKHLHGTISRIIRFTKDIDDEKYVTLRQKYWWIALRERSIARLDCLISEHKSSLTVEAALGEIWLRKYLNDRLQIMTD